MIRVNLLPQEERKNTSPVQLILAIVSAVVCVVLFVLYGYGLYSQWSLEKQMQELRTRQQVLEPVREEMELANNKQAAINKKASILDSLTKERKPWYAITAHFSTLTPQKVWLNEFSFTDKDTRVKGAAASYSDIALFLQQMEGDEVITEPILDKAEKDTKQNSVSFEILVKVKGMQ